MTAETVAIVYSRGADPRDRTDPSQPLHVVHDEIPVIEQALLRRGLEVLSFPVGESVLEDIRSLAERGPSLVINLCEDLDGDSSREMHFAAALELAGLSYTGSPPMALGLCRDKGRTKSLLRQHGIPTPDYMTVRSPGFRPGSLSYPLMVKPSLEDGSLGIDRDSIAGDEEGLRKKVSSLLRYHEEVLVEEYVDGREVNVAILGPEPLRSLPVSEIDFSSLPPGEPRITCYDAKWTEDSANYRGTVPICPAPLDETLGEKISSLSRTAFRILGMRDYGRMDWRLSETRGPMFLEANPNPDISPQSGFIRSLGAAGLAYDDLLDALIKAAGRRRTALDSSGSSCSGEEIT